MKGQDFQYTLNLNGRLNEAPDFENLIVKVEPGAGGRITRVRDVGRVELGAQTYSESFNLDGRPAAGIAVSLLPEANAVAVSNEVHDKMEELKKSFPEGLEYVIPYDTTKFVKAAIREVWRTLIEAGILVLIVILVFLQDWRAMLVPATTVPVTIIGAFAAMAALGFSINLPTLFAIILVIGIVVDDAIVIVEGVSRYVEQGMPGREAASRAMDELTGPVIGITLVLMSVFIPAAFLPGLTGQLFRQFALVIAATALISAINALTLKPTQSALWLRPPVPLERRNIFFRAFNWVYFGAEHGYVRLMSGMTGRALLMVGLALALVVFAIWALTRVPTGFLPTEDQGYMIVVAQLPDGASKERTDAVLAKIHDVTAVVPGVEHVVTVSGISILDNRASLANAGVAFVVLDDWDARLKHAGPGSGVDPAPHQRRACNRFPKPSPSPCCRRRSRASATSAASRCRSRSATAISTTTFCKVSPTPWSRTAMRNPASRVSPRLFAPARRNSRRGRQDEGGGDRDHRRPGFRRAIRLCRIELCRPVQQVRPRLPDLHAGEREPARLDRRHAQSQGEGGQRNNDADRHGGRGQRGDGPAADQPL